MVDVFPARLTGLGESAIERVRVYAQSGRLRIWKEEGRQAPKIYDGAVETVERDGGTRRSPYTALLADGQTLTIEPSGHCACGSPLKRIRPDREE